MFSTVVSDDRSPLHDHCGIFSILTPQNAAILPDAVSAFTTIQTRGYDGAGFWAIDAKGKQYAHADQGKIGQVFSKSVLKKLQSVKANVWVFQNRYGTSGDFSKDNVQPFHLVHTASGEPFCVAHNGQFLKQRPDDFQSQSDTLVFAQRVAASIAATWPERLSEVLRTMRGAYSIVLATRNHLYAVRDPYGIRPLSYGSQSRSAPHTWIVSSETHAIETFGGLDIHEVMPGELVEFTPAGVVTHQTAAARHKRAYCIFENVYIMDERTKAHRPSRSSSDIQSAPSINLIRFRSGQILATEAPVNASSIDFVCGIPGTGITGGQGFANQLLLPYVQAITDYAAPKEEQRTFMEAKIETILANVFHHFRIDFEMFRGRSVVLVDDSLVRGNVTKGLIALLREKAGVKRVHIRILCPPITAPCYLGINTRTKQELLAAQCDEDIKKMQAFIGADSLAFLTAQGLHTAVTTTPHSKGFCMGCMWKQPQALRPKY